MLNQRGFIYVFDDKPGLGIAARHEHENWVRLSFYAPGLEIDHLNQELQSAYLDELEGKGALGSAPTAGASILAGGIVFKSISCLAGELDSVETLQALEEASPRFELRYPQDLVRAEVIDAAQTYWIIYGRQLLGLLRIVFFEYATQLAIMGVSRSQDVGLIDEIYDGLHRLRDLLTVPKPLRTDEFDSRVEVHMFMIRVALKDEAELEFMKRLTVFPGLQIFDPRNAAPAGRDSVI